MNEQRVPTVFVSYSHKDRKWLDRFNTMLAPSIQAGTLEVWSDHEIAPGDKWKERVEQAMNGAQVALLLVSADFLGSDFIRNVELPCLLRRYEENAMKLFWVPLSPSLVETTALGRIQAARELDRPLDALTLPRQREAIRRICVKLLQLIPPVRPVPEETKVWNGLPPTGGVFLGRKPEIRLLDRAWMPDEGINIVVVVGEAGSGKTALLGHWLDRQKNSGWCGARSVFAWSFNRPVGVPADRPAEEDRFLDDALRWFGIRCDPGVSVWDKGRLLAEAVRRERSLLVLDAIESLQPLPGTSGRQWRAPGVQTLLHDLATTRHAGLCVVTTQELVREVAPFRRTSANRDGAVEVHELRSLETDGARLLYELGVRRCGAATIRSNAPELRAASRTVHHHALSLTLIGRYLTLSSDDNVGDVQRFPEVAFATVIDEIDNPALSAIAAFRQRFEEGGEVGLRMLAAARLLAFFDRPATPGCLAVLRSAPAIPGLTERLVGLSVEEWNITVNRLREYGLVLPAHGEPPLVDAHALVRESFAKELREGWPEAWREGHRRLYEHLKAMSPEQPANLTYLEPLYQSVVHGCMGGLHEQACNEVYWRRILRRDQHFSWSRLGSLGTDLAMLSHFFEHLWDSPVSTLSPDCKAWVLNQAADYLGGLGRLREATIAGERNVALRRAQAGWQRDGAPLGPEPDDAGRQASVVNDTPPPSTTNLAELRLDLGQVAQAEQDARESLAFARKVRDRFLCRVLPNTLAHVCHQAGARDEARKWFEYAESIQSTLTPHEPLLRAQGGFRYCSLLLSDAERAAWHVFCRRNRGDSGLGIDADTLIAECRAVAERAARTLELAESGQRPLDIGLDHLSLGRAALYEEVISSLGNVARWRLERARAEISAAVLNLRDSGHLDYLARGLISDAWLRFLEEVPDQARRNLNEAWMIAARGPMRLHMADIHLCLARLFWQEDGPGARRNLARARTLIDQCGYWRRMPELEDMQTLMAPAERAPQPASGSAGRRKRDKSAIRSG